MIRADDLTELNDRLLLDAQRAAGVEDWGRVIVSADEVLRNDPKRAEALFLAAVGLRKAGNEGVAAQLMHMASRIEPKRWSVWLELALATLERHPREAYKYALRAHELNPDHIDTLSVLCNVASVLGRHAEALDWADQAEAKYGVNPEVCHNKHFALMALGRWKEGWREFKASMGMANRVPRNYSARGETPRWNPNKHENAVVVIYGEQGLGDEVMYASMISAAIEAAEAKGSRVIVECYRRNEDLFRRSFPGATVYGTLREDYCEWPADEGVTHKLEMGGLGEYFAQEPFAGPSFLSADAAQTAAWAVWFEQHPFIEEKKFGGELVTVAREPLWRPRIGIAWTGGTWETGRGRRSVPFELIAQLMRGQDATFVCLEYEDRRRDLEDAPCEVLNPHWATRKGADMDGLAAILTNLDMVISVQTSVVDYAGALGVPCWALTDASPQWRYTGFFGDDTMGFYESVKVYRQREWGAWAPVIQRVAHDLKAFTEARKTAAVAAE